MKNNDSNQNNEILSLSNTINMMNDKIIKNNRLNSHINNSKYVQQRGLSILLNSIVFHTSFLESSASLNERRWCLVSGITAYPKCKICNKEIKKFEGNSYKGYRPYCSQHCANSAGTNKRTYQQRKLAAAKTVLTRKRKNNYAKFLKNVWSEEAKEKRKATNIKKYGVENPGILGAFSSKAAYKYIINYLKKFNISENKCYFKYGGINGEEFFQSINTNGKNIRVSYDLVVFKNEKSAIEKNINSIELVLEYNGPWHYSYEEVINDPDSKATPYQNSKTKFETYKYDEIKLNHIKNFCNHILIFWEKQKKLKKFK